jgi:hypothetical protein
MIYSTLKLKYYTCKRKKNKHSVYVKVCTCLKLLFMVQINYMSVRVDHLMYKSNTSQQVDHLKYISSTFQ